MSDKDPFVAFLILLAFTGLVYGAFIAYLDWYSVPRCIGIEPSGRYVSVSCP
ncbi:MAG: hypothetical protein WA194_00095 [Patescibacteria group bacterium]